MLQWLSYAYIKTVRFLAANKQHLVPQGSTTYVKLALELAVSPQLDEDHLVEEEPHQVERLRDMVRIIS